MRALATDLDGTLIPFDFANHGCDNSELSEAAIEIRPSTPIELQIDALERLAMHHARGVFQLIYVTGRDAQSALGCIQEKRLPSPEFLFCDVGTTLLRRVDDSTKDDASNPLYRKVQAYHVEMESLVCGIRAGDLGDFLGAIDRVELQELHKQGDFKRSYYCGREYLKSASKALFNKLKDRGLPYQVISSVDPFTGDGLIDLLPQGVHKGFAVRWWSRRYAIGLDDLIYAGDSGNDLAAFTMGIRSIIVGNASRSVVQAVLQHHQLSNTLDRVYICQHSATAGVLEGCQRFGLIDCEARQ